jgi:signal transduction histidine kinase
MLPLLSVSVASLLAVALIGWWLAARHTRGRIEGQLKGVVQVLATSNFPLTRAVLEKMESLSSAQFVLIDASGQMMVSSMPLELDSIGLPVDRVASGLEGITLGPSVTVAGKQYFHSSLEHYIRGGGDRPAVLHILFPCDEYRAAWRAAFFPPLAVGVVAILAVAAVTHLVAGRIIRVTRRLKDAVQRLADGNFTAVDLPARDDEVRDLAVAVNQTASRLVDYEQQVRRTEQLRTVALLGAGLAHEIRNAATGCRMAVDLHSENCLTNANDESLSVAKLQLYLMESRLQRFLQLGKQPEAINQRPLDLGQLVDELMALVEPTARHANVALDWHAPDVPITVEVDAEILGQAIINLVLNAIEAAQKCDTSAELARRVAVRISSTSGQLALLEVTDSGDGPSDEMAQTLFEPFVTSKQEGVGLGLAVAKQVVDAHGGTIDWTRAAGQTQFRISLPLAVHEPILQHQTT